MMLNEIRINKPFIGTLVESINQFHDLPANERIVGIDIKHNAPFLTMVVHS